MTPRVVVVGAGIAGLAASRCLRQEGFDVTLIEREWQTGGRLLTHHAAPRLSFDLGPQYLTGGDWLPGTSRSGTNREAPGAIDQLIRDSGRRAFTHRSPVGRIGPAEATDEADLNPTLNDFLNTGAVSIKRGMAQLADLLRPAPPHLPDGVTFCNQTQVTRIEQRDRQWRVRTQSTLDGSDDQIAADAVLLTPPIPISLDLIAQSEVTIPYELRNALQTVRYAGCFALAAAFPGPSRMGELGGIQFKDTPVEWVTDNRVRGVSSVGPALTALTTASWAADHDHEPDDAIIAQLLPFLRAWADGEPYSVRLHRWKYAQAMTPLSLACLVANPDVPLVFAGDAFAGAESQGIEAAYLSGMAAGRRIVQLIRRKDRFAVRRRARRYLLEVGVTGPDEAVRAETMGADRLELCSGLEVGGLTPSPGTFLEVQEAVTIPVYVLLRSRVGGFTLSDCEFATLRRDADWFLQHGADGIVFGIVRHKDGLNVIDSERCRELVRLVKLAGGRAVFHRAFDFLSNPLVALEELADIGFERVQTSGRSTTAEGGAGRLAAWIAHAGSLIEIMPAGGITPGTVSHLLLETQAHSVHASLRGPTPDPSLLTTPGLGGAMGVSDVAQGRGTTSADLVQEMRQTLDRLATHSAAGSED